MTDSEEKQNLFTQIRNLVAKIPKGKVSTYGDIAKALGFRDVRKVGFAMYSTTDENIPCHRVVNKEGFVSEKFSVGGAAQQQALLEAEGIIFEEEKKVDLEKYRFSNFNNLKN